MIGSLCSIWENHLQDLSKNLKLQQQYLGPFTVSERVTNTIYQKQVDTDRTNTKTAP